MHADLSRKAGMVPPVAVMVPPVAGMVPPVAGMVRHLPLPTLAGPGPGPFSPPPHLPLWEGHSSNPAANPIRGGRIEAFLRTEHVCKARAQTGDSTPVAAVACGCALPGAPPAFNLLINMSNIHVTCRTYGY